MSVKKAIIMFVLSNMLLGCINEDLSVCRTEHKTPHHLTFEYTHNIDFTDKFTDVLETVYVFVFDSNLKLIKIVSAGKTGLEAASYKMTLNLCDGIYTFVVWVNAHKSYRIFDNMGSTAPVTGGISQFEHMRLALDFGQSLENTGDLLYGVARNVRVEPGMPEHTHIGLTKNTNIINVTVAGLSNLEDSSLDIICVAANGEYRFDNSVSKPETMIHYIPERENTGDELKASFKTLRLTSGMKSELTVRNTNNYDNIFSRNLIELIMLSPNIDTDDDLDRNDIYDIKIDLHTGMSSSVIVNGYLVIDSEQELRMWNYEL